MHVIVVGSGIAGMSLTLRLIGFCKVTLITKDSLAESNTMYAQGGIAAVTSAEDNVDSHVADTLSAGAGLSDAEVARQICLGGSHAIAQLLAYGVPFDREPLGKPGDGLQLLDRHLEAAHSKARILHSHGDNTGHDIAIALKNNLNDAAINGLVTIKEHTFVKELLLREGKVSGVKLISDDLLLADLVILATGGAGHLYSATTNPLGATADGLALAWRAGAVIADPEMYQFHPTALDIPEHFLISEAVRGAGAYLLDSQGNRFMLGIDSRAELAPRDVVAREIFKKSLAQESAVLLDATVIGADKLPLLFPTIHETLIRHGFEWHKTPVPVTPAAHYWMGGIAADALGHTSLPGLRAIGECAATGLHGANRLASNSLLEGAVVANNCANELREVAIKKMCKQSAIDEVSDKCANLKLEIYELDTSCQKTSKPFSRDLLQNLMWRNAGLIRSKDGLQQAQRCLNSWGVANPSSREEIENDNLLLAARLIVSGALGRKESRGAHTRTDYPKLCQNPCRRGWKIR